MTGQPGDRLRRLYFFELFTIANLIAIVIVAPRTLPILGSPAIHILSFVLGLLPHAVVGIAVRSAIAWARRDHAYFRIIRSREWILDTVRLIVFSALMIFTYGWIKLVTPVVHPRLFDQQLWDLDQTLFFGFAPTVLFLDLFAGTGVLRAVDWSYANIFYASTVIALGYFFSEPSRRVRIGFANGNAALWLIGAWLYMLVPSLGPAYRFPDLWMPHEQALRTTQQLQAVLMRNYHNVLRVASGQQPRDIIRIVFGIAAFPSLHVAFQMYVFLWMRRLWTAGEVLFGILVFVIFLGSMVTGWHYLVDGIAGIALGWGCYALSWRASRMERWTAIKAAV